MYTSHLCHAHPKRTTEDRVRTAPRWSSRLVSSRPVTPLNQAPSDRRQSQSTPDRADYFLPPTALALRTRLTMVASSMRNARVILWCGTGWGEDGTVDRRAEAMSFGHKAGLVVGGRDRMDGRRRETIIVRTTTRVDREQSTSQAFEKQRGSRREERKPKSAPSSSRSKGYHSPLLDARSADRTAVCPVDRLLALGEGSVWSCQRVRQRKHGNTEPRDHSASSPRATGRACSTPDNGRYGVVVGRTTCS